MNVSDDLEEFLNQIPENDSISMRAITDNGSTIFFVTLLKKYITDELWTASLKIIDKFLHLVDAKELKYNFIFDNHTCDETPYMKLYELQQMLTQNVAILDRRLYSTTVITKSQAMKMVIEASFQIYKPRKPIKIILYENDLTTYKEALQFCRDNRSTKVILQ